MPANYSNGCLRERSALLALAGEAFANAPSGSSQHLTPCSLHPLQPGTCKDGRSFHWGSCTALTQRELLSLLWWSEFCWDWEQVTRPWCPATASAAASPIPAAAGGSRWELAEVWNSWEDTWDVGRLLEGLGKDGTGTAGASIFPIGHRGNKGFPPGEAAACDPAVLVPPKRPEPSHCLLPLTPIHPDPALAHRSNASPLRNSPCPQSCCLPKFLNTWYLYHPVTILGALHRTAFFAELRAAIRQAEDQGKNRAGAGAGL